MLKKGSLCEVSYLFNGTKLVKELNTLTLSTRNESHFVFTSSGYIYKLTSIFCLFNEDVNNSNCSASNDWIAANNELESE